jgi:hypothetical protein
MLKKYRSRISTAIIHLLGGLTERDAARTMIHANRNSMRQRRNLTPQAQRVIAEVVLGMRHPSRLNWAPALAL